MPQLLMPNGTVFKLTSVRDKQRKLKPFLSQEQILTLSTTKIASLKILIQLALI
jgi:hypothetical protein